MWLFWNRKIQNSNILIGNMLDKEAFDRQVNSIRSRYRKLCNPMHADQPNVSSFQHQNARNPPNQNYLFTTPIKTNKNPQYQEGISFSKFPQAGRESISTKVESYASKEPIMRMEKRSQVDSKRKVCLTSRQESNKKRELGGDLTERQKMLNKRVQDNQKLLRRSQKLREGECKSMSTVKEQKPNYDEQKVSSYQRKQIEKVPKITTKGLQYNFSPSASKQNKFERVVLTQRTSQAGRESTPLRKARENINDDYVNARTAFNQKMNQILDNFRTTPRQDKKSESKPKPTERKSKQVMPPASIEHIDLKLFQNMGSPIKKKEDLKVVSVFENTENIQQRIKAILFYH